MTAEEIKSHAIYKSLKSDQLRTFVYEMCTNGFDKLEAARVAHPNADEKSLTTLANRNVKHKGIKWLLALCQGVPNRDEYAIALNMRATLADDDKIARDFYELLGKTLGYITKPAENTSAPAAGDKSLHELALEIEGKI